MTVHRWTLDMALELIRALQPIAQRHEYFLLLGGGVLNRGYSDHDLDIVAACYVASPTTCRPNQMLAAFLDQRQFDLVWQDRQGLLQSGAHVIAFLHSRSHLADLEIWFPYHTVDDGHYTVRVPHT